MWIWRYHRGAFVGGFTNVDIMPTISCSSFEHNNYLVIQNKMNKMGTGITVGKLKPTNGKVHQQDFVQRSDGVCRAIPAGTHGSTPHLLKTIIINKNNKKMETKKEKKSLIPLTLPKELEDLDFEIRKLTPRECFRIMDVDDADIDKIQATGLSKSAQYKLAGNSICVNVLCHLFRKMFIEKENESRQLNLFG